MQTITPRVTSHLCHVSRVSRIINPDWLMTCHLPPQPRPVVLCKTLDAGDELKSIFCSQSQLGTWREMRWQDRDPQYRGELIKGWSVQCLWWCQVLTGDTRHVTRYYEINMNSFQSHSRCPDWPWPLILKLSLKEMRNYFTDDNVSPSFM